MLILALESATIGVGVALVGEEGVLCSMSEISQGRSTETLHPLISQVMHAAGVATGELDAIAVDIGPGLFTGLRVGVTTAKTLAFALEIPVLGVTSTMSLLAGASMKAARSIAVIDMRRSEVVYATDDAPESMSLATPMACVEDLRSRPELLGARIVGDGVGRYEAIFAGVIREYALVVGGDADRFVDPGVLGTLAFAELRAGAGVKGADLEPLYLRAPDAKINWSTRDSARQDER